MTLEKINHCLNELASAINDRPGNLTNQIVKFFKSNPSPSDEKVHAFADQIGIEESIIEKEIYALLSYFIGKTGGDILKGGLADQMDDHDFDAKELRMGIKIEMEHTNDPLLAKEIAKDHLAEIPDYYSRLIAMEKEAESEIDFTSR